MLFNCKIETFKEEKIQNYTATLTHVEIMQNVINIPIKIYVDVFEFFFSLQVFVINF